jgi:hypothetical protein
MRQQALVVAAAVALLGPPASAELLVPVGMGVSLGGGANEFVGPHMRRITGVGGAWSLRGILGTREHVALEAGYAGSAHNIDTLGLDDATLVATAFEGVMRLNALRGPVQPFGFAGVGWKRYDLTNASANTSSVATRDNVFEVPFGVGLALRHGALLLDVRATYRHVFEADLVPVDEGHATMRSWETTAQVGWEF